MIPHMIKQYSSLQTRRGFVNALYTCGVRSQWCENSNLNRRPSSVVVHAILCVCAPAISTHTKGPTVPATAETARGILSQCRSFSQLFVASEPRLSGLVFAPRNSVIAVTKLRTFDTSFSASGTKSDGYENPRKAHTANT
jgi:hypothetical protein